MAGLDFSIIQMLLFSVVRKPLDASAALTDCFDFKSLLENPKGHD